VAFAANALVGVGHAAFWPANQSLIAAILPEERRQRYFGLSFTLLNAGIGVGGLAGAAYVHVGDPSTFQSLYLADAFSFVVPLVLLAWPLRHVGNGTAAHAAEPGSYREVLADRVFLRLLVLSLVSSFVGYGMMEAGWTAFARTVADASTGVIGVAFAANTATIVLLQLVVLRLIEGRRRTRLIALLACVWAAAYVVMGLAGLAPGTTGAAVLLVASMAVFALGETLLSPVAPALTNALAPDRLRGRYNAVASTAFQVGAIAAPVTAGFLLGAGSAAVFVVVLIAGCGVLAVAALRLERHLPASVNGVRGAVVPEPGADPVSTAV
jgi:MFS family permease